MGITTKGRSKLHVGSRLFVWWVKENRDGPGHVLRVCSDDKRFMVMYQLGQAEGEEYLVVLGKEFEGAETGQCWRRFRCARWEVESAITPGSVRRLIDWCYSKELKTECQFGDFSSHGI